MAGSALKQKVESIRDLLVSRQSEIARALPKHVDADRMLRVVLTSLAKTPKLLDCTKTSLYGAVMESAQLGLMPDGVVGEAYLVPYGDKATLIPGYKGLIALARRSGEVSTVEARVVREGDVFEYRYGLESRLEHTPDPSEQGEMTFVYCVVRLRDGGIQWEVMPKAAVDAVRKRSRASSSGPWVTDYDAMALKTVIRKTLKLCPCSTELQGAIAKDEQREIGLDTEVILPADMEEESVAGDGENVSS